MTAEFCRVAVDSPVLALDRPFDYRIPGRLMGRVGVGSVVRVPLHGRRIRGFVIELLDAPAVADPSALSSLVSPEPLLGEPEIALARWTAERYVSSLGSVLHRATPGRFSTTAPGDPARPPVAREAPPGLERLEEVVARRGRTIVVGADPVQTAAHVAGLTALSGHRTLVIAPRVEIVEAVGRAIPGTVLVHGDLKPAARSRAWAAARDGLAWVVAGGRSALFTPLPGLGCVVVLDAHDRALKDERAPRIHALPVALRRASGARAAFVAVSSSPPLEVAGPHASRYLWLEARHARVRTEIASPRGGPVTPHLLDVVRAGLDSGSSALVFIARRGLALRVRCEECGWYPRCDRCGTGLALFGGPSMRCRSCGRGAASRSTCPDCGGRRLGGVGWGSERLEAALDGAGLGAPVLRVDADSPLPRRRPERSVVVGTGAALAAGPFASVAVADLDHLLALPDLRAGERAFQTLCELSRGLVTGGRFLVQTREPEHHAVQGFVRGSFRWFAQRELPRRRAASYPPYGVVVRVDMESDDAAALRRAVRAGGGEVVGPIVRPDGTGTALVRAGALEGLLGPLRAFAAEHPTARVDVDPADLL